jgi:drug/metabolite transporter superfamily protein YnfA
MEPYFDFVMSTLSAMLSSFKFVAGANTVTTKVGLEFLAVPELHQNQVEEKEAVGIYDTDIESPYTNDISAILGVYTAHMGKPETPYTLSEYIWDNIARMLYRWTDLS